MYVLTANICLHIMYVNIWDGDEGMFYYLLPEYIDNEGNCCRIKDEEGERVIRKSIVYALKDVFDKNCMDMRLVKRRCSRIINQKNLVPFYDDKGVIYMPVKVRKPRIKKDTGYGYINCSFIAGISDSELLLKDNGKIIYLERYRTIIKRLKMAKIIKEHIEDNEIDFAKVSEELKCPATKQDALILLREIIEIKRMMER